jgi:hypothetical protein
LAAANVVGFLTDISLAPLDTALTFTPTNLVLVTRTGLSAGPARTIVSSNGAFSIVLEAGDYTVSLPLIKSRLPFAISVPPGDATINITSLLTAPSLYVYYGPPSAALALTNSNFWLTDDGQVQLRRTNGDPLLSLTTNRLEVLGSISTAGDLAARSLRGALDSADILAGLGYQPATNDLGAAHLSATVERDSPATYRPADWFSNWTVASSAPSAARVTPVAVSAGGWPRVLLPGTPILLDTNHAKVLVTDGSSLKSCTVLDGAVTATNTLVAALASTPPFSTILASYPASAISYGALASDGSYLLTYGGISSDPPGGSVLRSTDQGATWTAVWSSPSNSGCPVQIQLIAPGKLVTGTYTSESPNRWKGNMHVVYSEDNGATWSIIATYSHATLYHHFHGGLFLDDFQTNLFFQEGDANTPHTFWLQKPAGWSPGAGPWTALNLNTNFQSTSSETIFTDAGYVYKACNEAIWHRYQPLTDTFDALENFPSYTIANTNAPFWYEDTKVISVFMWPRKLSSGFFAPNNFYAVAGLSNSAGLYVSPDFERWTAHVRGEPKTPWPNGIRAALGELGGYTYLWANSNGVFSLASLPTPAIALRHAVRVGPALTNLFPDSFMTTATGWFTDAGPPDHTVRAATDPSVIGGVIQADAAGSRSNSRFYSPAATLPDLVAGDKITFTCLVRAPAGKPMLMLGCSAVGANSVNTAAITEPVPNHWKKQIMELYVTAPISGAGFRWNFRLSAYSDNPAAWTGLSVQIAQPLFTITRGPAARYATIDDWQSSATNLASETVALPCAHLSRSFTLGWFWKPGLSDREFPTNYVAIATLKSAAHWLDVRYNTAAARLELLSDQQPTPVQSTNTVTFMHHDLVRFYLASNGTDTTLYTLDPVNGQLTTVAAGVGLSAPPALATFGANNDGSLFGLGCFGGLETLNAAVSSGAVSAKLSTLPPELSVAPAWSSVHIGQ